MRDKIKLVSSAGTGHLGVVCGSGGCLLRSAVPSLQEVSSLIFERYSKGNACRVPFFLILSVVFGQD